jgi:threonine dehydrogenase-like Zn-dependent dehydrogenase
MTIPTKQYAVQLVGPSQLRLNKDKEVFQPGPYQILAKIECVGLCFSDLKLLKQFSDHARKSEIVSGLSADVLKDIPSYVPGQKPTVPGHEVTCRIVAIGVKVKNHKVGERCLVQTDYRALKTANSNAAFGYNFEGALQEYALMDERVVMDPASGQRFLIPVPEHLSASAVALVEPWACVEDSYVNIERQTIKAGGKLLIISSTKLPSIDELELPYSPDGGPEQVLFESPENVANLPKESFDDIIYFGADKAIIELLNDKLAARGIINIVLCGQKIGQPVSVGIGRVHYGMTRWIGTRGHSAAASYHYIPPTGELRRGDHAVIIGAGGPMGQMHVIRGICSGVSGISVTGTDMDDGRLESLRKKAQPLAKANRVDLRLINTQKNPLNEKFTYFALMAPVGALVANAIRDSNKLSIINIFAGIPATTRHEIDLDTYIANHCYMIGTSGSVIRDMLIVLQKVQDNQLDTNCSVDAVSGMAGATDGIAAVENRTLAGKILVYPMLHELGLTPLSELPKKFPTVAAKLQNGNWCRAAELELLHVAK